MELPDGTLPEVSLPLPGQQSEFPPQAPAEGLVAGVVVSRSAGFYWVEVAGGQLRLCQLRGRLRSGDSVLVGDRVWVRPTPDGRGVIEQVGRRTSQLRRPPVANVSLAVAVMALAQPEPDLELLDRLLAAAQAAGLQAVVCWNKADLVPAEQARRLVELYRQAGYEALATSALTGFGVPELRQRLAGHISTLCGPSGVGKSALINALCPDAGQATGEVSPRLGRGRHTTRTVRLLPLAGGGWVADTPGFSRLELAELAPRDLSRLMPDIARQARECRFGADCLHVAEPHCAVREAVSRGSLAESRYRSYRKLLRELQELEASRYG